MLTPYAKHYSMLHATLVEHTVRPPLYEHHLYDTNTDLYDESSGIRTLSYLELRGSKWPIFNNPTVVSIKYQTYDRLI